MLALHLAAHVIGDCTRDISGSRRGLASGSRRSDEQQGKYRDQSCGESRLTKAAGGFGHRWAGIAVAEKEWRRGSESNRRIKVLQTSPLPLGYRAPAQYVSVPCEKSPFAGENLRGRKMERETRVELATSTLARLRSTTELLPPCESDYK